MLVDDQSEALAFLGAPERYPGNPPVERIDTHTSAVFLAGDRAYKVKRAVRYDYLDYSTVERRSAACEAEIRLNRRTAPTLYEGVVPLARAASGALHFDGGGPSVDWVVVMRRFAQDRVLDRLATARALTPAITRRDMGGADAIRASSTAMPATSRPPAGGSTSDQRASLTNALTVLSPP